MPELPEVEVVRRGLNRFVAGRTVRTVEVFHPRAVRWHLPGASDFSASLVGAQLRAAHRRGKYLWVPYGWGEALVAHLGMSGQLLVRPVEAPDEAHLRVRFRFADDGPQLRFVDQRTFGGLSVSRTLIGGVPAEIVHIAFDPLDPAFDDDAFRRSLRRRRTGIKRALLDQSLISGVGNIYADEALWHARLHYARPTETLTGPEVTRLLAALRAVMTAALADGGTSFDSLYVDVNGSSGYFDRSLQVYGRVGQPCRRCGTPIRRDPFMNRSSYTCPRCQPRPRRARW
ncbi:MAG: bifunctional DNA-formamidopyrimidine glycosylase/DNA-(apurinic or apyrimidinic site) lyase [Jiangellaceae bacterium]